MRATGCGGRRVAPALRVLNEWPDAVPKLRDLRFPEIRYGQRRRVIARAPKMALRQPALTADSIWFVKPLNR